MLWTQKTCHCIDGQFMKTALMWNILHVLKLILEFFHVFICERLYFLIWNRLHNIHNDFSKFVFASKFLFSIVKFLFLNALQDFIRVNVGRTNLPLHRRMKLIFIKILVFFTKYEKTFINCVWKRLIYWTIALCSSSKHQCISKLSCLHHLEHNIEQPIIPEDITSALLTPHPVGVISARSHSTVTIIVYPVECSKAFVDEKNCLKMCLHMLFHCCYWCLLKDSY